MLSPAKQKEMARSLEAAGFVASDVDLVARWAFIHSEDQPQARRYIASALSNSSMAKESLVELKKHAMDNPEQLQEDGDFGAYQRKKDKERQVQHDLDYFEWVSKMKEAGNWPPKRDPHPWENGVVKPPKQEAPIARKPHNPNQDRIDDCRHLAGCAKLFVDNKRPIPGHIRTSLKKLGAHWSAAGVPPEVRAALG